jgi:hypothetical protein
LPTSSVSAVQLVARTMGSAAPDLREPHPNVAAAAQSELRTDAGAAARSLGDGSGVGLVKLS